MFDIEIMQKTLCHKKPPSVKSNLKTTNLFGGRRLIAIITENSVWYLGISIPSCRFGQQEMFYIIR